MLTGIPLDGFACSNHWKHSTQPTHYDADLSLLSLDLNNSPATPPITSPSQSQRRHVLVENDCEDSVVFVQNDKVVFPFAETPTLEALMECGPHYLDVQTGVHEDMQDEVSFYQKNCMVGCVSITASLMHPPVVDVSSSLMNPPVVDVSSSLMHPPNLDVSSSLMNPPNLDVSSSLMNPPNGDVSSSLMHPPNLEAPPDRTTTSPQPPVNSLMAADVRSIDRECLQAYAVRQATPQFRFTLDLDELNILTSRYAYVASDVTLPEVQGVLQTDQGEEQVGMLEEHRRMTRGIRDDCDGV